MGVAWPHVRLDQRPKYYRPARTGTPGEYAPVDRPTAGSWEICGGRGLPNGFHNEHHELMPRKFHPISDLSREIAGRK